MSDWLDELTAAPVTGGPGWYGKLLDLGDFAHRRLPADCVTQLDGWLSACLSASRAALGERWLDIYLRSPLWQFLLGAGVLDSQAWAGTLMPSVDAVGRYFPLVVLQPLDSLPDSETARGLLGDWFRHVAQSSLATLGEATPVEHFDARLLAAPPLGPAPPGAAPPLPGERWTLPADADCSQVLAAVNRSALAQQMQGHSLWWPFDLAADAGTDGHADALVVGAAARPAVSVTLVSALPDPQRYAALLQRAL